MADVYLIGEDHEALHRTIPENLRLVAEAVPWEYAVAVGKQQAVYAQVSAYGKESVVLGQMRVGEGDGFVELEYHDGSSDYLMLI